MSADAQAQERPSERLVLLLSTSDTDLLSARASGAAYRLGNPARLGVADLPELLDGADLVVVRLLGGRRSSAASRPPTPS